MMKKKTRFRGKYGFFLYVVLLTFVSPFAVAQERLGLDNDIHSAIAKLKETVPAAAALARLV